MKKDDGEIAPMNLKLRRTRVSNLQSRADLRWRDLQTAFSEYERARHDVEIERLLLANDEKNSR